MAQLYPSVPAKTLQVDLASTDTTLVIDDILDWNGTALTTGQFSGDYIPATLINDAKTKVEFILITASTITSAAGGGATIYKRGLALYATGTTATDQTEVSANKLDWTSGETKVLLGTNPPYMMGTFLNRYNDETISGTYTFANTDIPKLDSYAAPTADEELAPKKYVDDVAAGGTASINRIVPSATAGETIAAGELVYFDFTDNEWKLCDADTATTVEQVLLGIAQGAGTNGAAIAGGVLLWGLDANQSGLTEGDQLFASNTAGAIGNSAGTTERCIGVARSDTEIYFDPQFFHTIKEADKDKLEAITASAAEINVLDGYTGNTADLNEMETFFGSTDITGAEAETLTDGSNADSLHTHSGMELLGVINDVSNSGTSETTLFSTTIAAGTLGTAGAIIGHCSINGRHASGNWVLKIKYGSTTLATITESRTNLSTNTGRGTLHFGLTADGSTSAQNAFIGFNVQETNAGVVNINQSVGSATEDSTGALTFAVTIQCTNTTNTEIACTSGSVYFAGS